MADLTHLNATELQYLLDHEVAEFVKELKDVREDDSDGARALRTLLEGYTTPDTLDQNQVLAIGTMAADNTTHGQSLVEAVIESVQAIDDILAAQQVLFKDIEGDLGTTIDTLLAKQGDSLAAIDGEKLLDIFGDVDEDLASDTGSSDA
ncbi:type VII secretion system-associated protein [Streptomyces sp. NPDC090106]|uniref:type VII secretion system-associated protein n=1 Tax=Streptomyces sp. NPDC090106 TaxID=3365946 RepID=UPI0037F1102D